MRRIVDLRADHDAFALHVASVRDGVHRRRVAGAARELAWTAARLRAHVELEESELLPRFERLDHPVPNGTPDVLRDDHRQVLRWLAAAEAGFDGDPVALCDALARLDGVLEHHDRREARYFLGRLDAVVPEAVQAAILGPYDARVRALGPPPPADPTASDAPPIGPGTGLATARAHLAVGDAAGARRALAALQPGPHPKAGRHRDAAIAAIDAGSLPLAWDRLRLLALTLGAANG